MEFKALQRYSDGEAVRWIEPAKADGNEPEHPAPTLKLAHSGCARPAATGLLEAQ
jgi:periplasmic copper chaperone A